MLVQAFGSVGPHPEIQSCRCGCCFEAKWRASFEEVNQHECVHSDIVVFVSTSREAPCNQKHLPATGRVGLFCFEDDALDNSNNSQGNKQKSVLLMVLRYSHATSQSLYISQHPHTSLYACISSFIPLDSYISYMLTYAYTCFWETRNRNPTSAGAKEACKQNKLHSKKYFPLSLPFYLYGPIENPHVSTPTCVYPYISLYSLISYLCLYIPLCPHASLNLKA